MAKGGFDLVQAKLTAKDYLLGIFYTTKEIEEKKRLLADLIKKQAPKDVTIPNLEKIGSNTHCVVASESVCNKIILIQQEIAKLSEKVCEAIDEINKIKTPQERTVLMYRYIYGMRFSEISDLMRLSKSRIFFLHREALKNFEKV